MMKKRALLRLIVLVMVLIALFSSSHVSLAQSASPVSLSIQTPSAVLMEAETGKILFSVGADTRRPIASVNKIMTLLLVMEALDDGRIKLSDSVQISKHASGMGGSQVLLDADAHYTIQILIKSVIMASGNDASVALAETIYGSEELFVQKMNERVKRLGLKNTLFANCSGLPATSHYSTAYDVAQMSRELIKHKEVFNWSTKWLDELVHPSGRKTMLANTNRLIKYYEGADGLKTGSTSEARYCLSATAKRGNMRLIAVVLGAPSTNIRFADAQKLLDYGFSNYQFINKVKANDIFKEDIPVKSSDNKTFNAVAKVGFPCVIEKGQDKNITMESLMMQEDYSAPIQKGQKVGELIIRMGQEEMKRIDLIADRDVPLINLWVILKKIFHVWIHQ